jgi:hypothetical protein
MGECEAWRAPRGFLNVLEVSGQLWLTREAQTFPPFPLQRPFQALEV